MLGSYGNHTFEYHVATLFYSQDKILQIHKYETFSAFWEFSEAVWPTLQKYNYENPLNKPLHEILVS